MSPVLGAPQVHHHGHQFVVVLPPAQGQRGLFAIAHHKPGQIKVLLEVYVLPYLASIECEPESNITEYVTAEANISEA